MSRIKLSLDFLERRDVPATVFTELPQVPDLNPLVLNHIKAVAEHGQQLGRKSDVFMKVGDSNTATPDYLVPLGQPGFNPATSGLTAIDPQLGGVIDTYLAPADSAGDNSFTRPNLSEHGGWRAEDVIPTIPEEVATTNASVALILIGTNDAVWYSDVEAFRSRLGILITELESAGVVPVLSTIPDDFYNNGAYAGRVPLYNQVIADVADQYRDPVMNLWQATHSLPNDGLKSDELHLSISPAGAGVFQASDLLYGQNVREVLTLKTFEELQNEVWKSSPLVPPTSVRSSWTPLMAGTQYYVTGADQDVAPVVRVYDAGSGQVVDSFPAYASDFSGGVRVAFGDVNGDGIPDVVTAPGGGGGPNVRVFSGRDGSLIDSFFAFEPSFVGGTTVAVAALAGNGRDQVIVGAGEGGGPRVRVFDATDSTLLRDFFAYDPSFRGGVNVAGGDFGGTGPAVVAGAGSGGGPVVEVFRYSDLQLVSSFFAYDPSLRGGVSVAAGDLSGNGTDDVVTGPGTDAPNVRVFDPVRNVQVLSFYAGPAQQGGVLVAVIPSAGGNAAKIVTGNGPGAPAAVRLYTGLEGPTRQDAPGDANDWNAIPVAG